MLRPCKTWIWLWNVSQEEDLNLDKFKSFRWDGGDSVCQYNTSSVLRLSLLSTVSSCWSILTSLWLTLSLDPVRRAGGKVTVQNIQLDILSNIFWFEIFSLTPGRASRECGGLSRSHLGRGCGGVVAVERHCRPVRRQSLRYTQLLLLSSSPPPHSRDAWSPPSPRSGQCYSGAVCRWESLNIVQCCSPMHGLMQSREFS